MSSVSSLAILAWIQFRFVGILRSIRFRFLRYSAMGRRGRRTRVRESEYFSRQEYICKCVLELDWTEARAIAAWDAILTHHPELMVERDGVIKLRITSDITVIDID